MKEGWRRKDLQSGHLLVLGRGGSGAGKSVGLSIDCYGLAYRAPPACTAGTGSANRRWGHSSMAGTCSLPGVCGSEPRSLGTVTR